MPNLLRLSASWLIAALAIAPCGAPCSGQTAKPAQSPALAGIAHAAIRVADLNNSRDFYRKLGFEEAFAFEKDGVPTQSFIKVNDRQFIELYPRRQASEPIGFLHVCFESTGIEELNRYYVSQGLSPIPVRKAGAGNLLFTMEGPEKQNIEYTQYMPGSRHSSDTGKHLGPDRISDRILAAGIEMQDSAAARAYYIAKLAFSAAGPLLPSEIWLQIPGSSGQQIEIVQHKPDSAFQLYFAVPNLRRAALRLKALQIPFEKHTRALSIHDPDGNRLIFLRANPA